MSVLPNRTAFVAALALAVLVSLAAHPLSAQADVERVLRDVADASGADIRALRDGEPFVRIVEGDDPRGLTLVHAVRVRAPVSFILDRARGQHLLLDDASGPNARGVFQKPPSPDDLSPLEFDRRELRNLERCRIDDCDHKLTEETIERLHSTIDWDSRSAREDATRFFRNEMVTTLTEYAERGNAGAPVYADKPERLAASDGLEQLLLEAEYLLQMAPGLYSHLSRYPDVRSEAIEDRFSWTVEDLGTRSIVSLHHVAVDPTVGGGAAVVGAKRLYSNHYLQAGLRVLLIAPADEPAEPDSYIAIVTQLRFDGEVGGLKRMAMERRLEANALEVLGAVRDGLEAEYER